MEYYERMCQEMADLAKKGIIYHTNSSIAITYTWKTSGLFSQIRPFNKGRFDESVAQLVKESDILRAKVIPDSQIIEVIEDCKVSDDVDSINTIINSDNANIIIRLSDDPTEKSQSLEIVIPHILFDGMSGGLLIKRFFEIYILKTISCGCLGKQWPLDSSIALLQKRRSEQEQALTIIKQKPKSSLFDSSLEVNGVLSPTILPPLSKKVPERWPTYSFTVPTADIQHIATQLSKQLGKNITKEVASEVLSYIALTVINKGPVTTRKTFHGRRSDEMRSPSYVATAKPYGFKIQDDWTLSDIFNQSKRIIKSLVKGESASIPIEKLIEEKLLDHAPQVGLNILPKSTGNPDPPLPKLIFAKYMESYLGPILGVDIKSDIFLSDWYTQSKTYDVQLDVTGITDTQDTEFQVSLTRNCNETTGNQFERAIRTLITAYKSNPMIRFGSLKKIQD